MGFLVVVGVGVEEEVAEMNNSLVYIVVLRMKVRRQAHMALEVEEVASLVEVEALHYSIVGCSFVGHTLGCILVHMALVVEVVVVVGLVGDVVEGALALQSSMLDCIVVEHMMVSRKDRKASLLLNMLLHSIVGCMMVHKTEDSFAHKSCMVSLGGKWVVRVDVQFPGNQEHSNGNRIQACKYVHTEDRKIQDVLVS